VAALLLGAGQRLVEEELAASIGVTRQSLRAALLDLTAEGLVERIPNRGARVRVVSVEEALQIKEAQDGEVTVGSVGPDRGRKREEKENSKLPRLRLKIKNPPPRPLSLFNLVLTTSPS